MVCFWWPSFACNLPFVPITWQPLMRIAPTEQHDSSEEEDSPAEGDRLIRGLVLMFLLSVFRPPVFLSCELKYNKIDNFCFEFRNCNERKKTVQIF